MPAGMPLREKQIMEKLFELKKLSANDIAFVLGCNVQTVLRRKREFESNGTITAVKEMSWQKVKPEHVEKIHAYVQEAGENTSLQQVVNWLAEECNLKVSTSTVSKILSAKSEAEGKGRRKARAPRTERRDAFPGAEGQSASPGVQPQLVAQQAVQFLNQPEKNRFDMRNEAPVVPLEVAAQQARPAEAMGVAGEV